MVSSSTDRIRDKGDRGKEEESDDERRLGKGNLKETRCQSLFRLWSIKVFLNSNVWGIKWFDLSFSLSI